MTLPIYSVTPFTLLDFPQRTACIIWFSGCNMRCGYCHNPQIVKGKGTLDASGVLSFLNKRRGLLDGVVLSGGEASLYQDIINFAHKIKMMGFAIKLDTNGLRPEIVQELLTENLVDYIALDYKSPPDKFRRVTGVDKFTDFEKTLSLLCGQNSVPFEIRTTVHTDMIDEKDIRLIIADLEARHYKGEYFIQNFQFNEMRPTLHRLKPQSCTLDCLSLPTPNSFRIEFRNFPTLDRDQFDRASYPLS